MLIAAGSLILQRQIKEVHNRIAILRQGFDDAYVARENIIARAKRRETFW